MGIQTLQEKEEKTSLLGKKKVQAFKLPRAKD